MRYLFNETTNLVGRLPTGQAVVIEIYAIETGVQETLTSQVCTEIGTTGLFKWSKTDLATQPTVYTEYVYTMIDALNNRYDGKFVIHGDLYAKPSDVLIQNLITG